MATKATPVEQTHDRVRNLLEGAFPPALDRPRHVGPEDEFPVVDAEGHMANLAPLFAGFVRDGWKPKEDPVTHALIGVHGDDGLDIGMDVGVGTLEIAWPHVDNLFEHMAERSRVLAMVDGRLSALAFTRLADYACQPLTVPTRDCWAPKGRANVFRDLFHPSVHNQTLSTSAQVHVELTQSEVIPATELFLSIAPVLVALNANSPVWGGTLDPAGMLAARQDFWYRFTVEHGYWGNVLCGSVAKRTERAPTSFHDLARLMYTPKFLVHVHADGRMETPDVPFDAWAASPERDLSDEEFRLAFCNHEGTLWWDARPRVPFGTIEVRPMCQNREAWASHALVLGLVENLATSLAYVRMCQSYVDWRIFQKDALRYGMEANHMDEFARRFIDLARDGLLWRGLNEELLLQPLERRTRHASSPGMHKKSIFLKDGMNALLKELMG